MKESWNDWEEVWNPENFRSNNLGRMYSSDRMLLQVWTKRFFYQTGIAVLLFFLLLAIFQWRGPAAMVVQETVRYVLCAEESDLTPVLEAMARQGLWLDSVDRQVFQKEGGRMPGDSPEPLAIPVSGKYVRGFGEIESPVDGRLVFHSGIDILTETGAPVRASLDGEVVNVYADPVLGRTVEIQHDYGLTTVYGNFGEILVEKGQWIRQGEIIGKAGEAGGSHGGNLHFEVRENGKPVDPLAKMATVRTSI